MGGLGRGWDERDHDALSSTAAGLRWERLTREPGCYTVVAGDERCQKASLLEVQGKKKGPAASAAPRCVVHVERVVAVSACGMALSVPFTTASMVGEGEQGTAEKCHGPNPDVPAPGTSTVLRLLAAVTKTPGSHRR